MILISPNVRVYLYTPPIDMRKAIDGLSILVAEALEGLPQSGDVFLFHNRAADKIKILYWDINGFIMHYKRLEKGRFKIARQLKNPEFEITQDQLGWLLAGLDFMLMQECKMLNFEHYF